MFSLVLPLLFCVGVGSSVVDPNPKTIPAFTSVIVCPGTCDGGVTVRITPGNNYTFASEPAKLDAYVDGTDLHLYFSGDSETVNSEVIVSVTLPRTLLRSVTVSGDSVVVIEEGFEPDQFNLTLSGSALAYVGEMQTPHVNSDSWLKLELLLSGSSRAYVNLDGNVAIGTLKTSGSSKLVVKADAEMSTVTADNMISSGSSQLAFTSDKLNCSLLKPSGSSKLNIDASVCSVDTFDPSGSAKWYSSCTLPGDHKGKADSPITVDSGATIDSKAGNLKSCKASKKQDQCGGAAVLAPSFALALALLALML